MTAGGVVVLVLLLTAITLRGVDDEVRLLGLAWRAAAAAEAVDEARRVQDAVEAGTSGVRDSRPGRSD